jgi:hypothetical protein
VYYRPVIVNRRVIELLAVCATLAVASCGGGGGGGAPGGGRGGAGGGSATGSGHLAATIDGQAWVADQSTIQVSASGAVPGTLTINGSHVVSATNYLSLTLALGYINGPRTYPLGVNPGTNAGGTVSIFDQSGAGAPGIWMTDFTGSRGTLTVTSMSATNIAGTFELMAPPGLGSTATNTRTVTAGGFDLPLPAAFTMTTADDYGSFMSATINGQPWNGATVEGAGAPAGGTFGGTTTGISLTVSPLVAIQAGMTYDQTMVRFQASGDGMSWGGGTNDLSSLTVTAVTGTRAAGTFMATLLGPSSTISFSAGMFNVRFPPGH